MDTLWTQARLFSHRYRVAALRVTSRDSYKALEEYSGQSEDDDAPHAVAGRKVATKFKELLDDYREMMPDS